MTFKSLIEGYSKSQELAYVKQLIDICKLDEADQVITKFEEEGGHTPIDIIVCNLLKCELFSTQGLHGEVVKLADQTYKESLGLKKTLLSVDLLLTKALSLLTFYQTEKAHSITKQGEELLKILIKDPTAEKKLREARIAYLKGWIYDQKLDANKALDQFKLSLSLREELGVKEEIAMSLYGIAHIYMVRKGDYDLALKSLKRCLILAEESESKLVLGRPLFYMARLYGFKGDLDRSIMYAEQSLQIFRDINNRFMITRSLYILGESYIIKGELDQSIRFFEQSLELSREIDNKFFMGAIYRSLSSSYRMKGELDHALDCIEESMSIHRELGALEELANSHDILIQILIDRGDHERAQNSLRDLEQLNSQLKNKRINMLYLFEKALVLKIKSRALNRGKAEEILKQLINEEDLFYESRLMVVLSLCELLVADLQITNEVEILEEIKPLIKKLLDLSEKSHSFWILGETYLLQAKLALLNFNVKGARRFLTQAQKIAESYGIKRLAMQISQQHDELLRQMSRWEYLKESDASLSERWKLAGLNEQMEKMVKKRISEAPKISEEEPIRVLIITEGGTSLFSHSFTKEKAFESHIFSSFLTTIDYFIREMFSEGLDRAVFGEYTLIMKSIPPFFISYIFKGDSYYAHQKINYFIDHIQKEESIWQKLLKSFQINQSIHLKDVPLLESLITETFITKNIVYSELELLY